VVLSHRFWRIHFESDPSVVGKTLTLGRQPFTIIGVAASDFVGTQVDVPDAWIPLMMRQVLTPGDDALQDRDGHFLQVAARLKHGVSRAKAQVGMDVLAHQIAAAHPESNRGTGVRLARLSLVPLDVRKQVAPIATLVLAVVGLLLLIACTNVTNLTLARVAARQKELAIRLAVGASRGRLVRQLITESTVLALLGGFAGLLLGTWITQVLLAVIIPPSLASLALNFSPDLRTAGYALALAFVCMLAIGLAPAWQATRWRLTSALRTKDQASALAFRRFGLRNVLVIAQLSVSVVLLVAAGLLVRGLQKAQATDPGFDLKHALVVQEDLRSFGYDAPRIAAFYEGLIERLRNIPGVRSVSLCETVPLGDNTAATGVQLEGLDAASKELSLTVGMNRVSPAFFETLRIPLLQGRLFSEAECRSGARVAIINEVLAKRLWRGKDPIGRRYRGSDSDPWTEVVGIVRGTRSSRLYEADEPYVYLPYHPRLDTNALNMAVLLTTQNDPKQAIGSVRVAVRALDPNLRPSVRALEENLEAWIAPSRSGALISSALGLLGLALASLGLYGVTSFMANQRTHEIGVRIALGASRAGILRLMLHDGFLLVAAGLGIGLMGGLALTQAMEQFLFGLSPVDPAAFAGVSLFLAGVAGLACYLPARRATKVNPIEALRYE
jgi:putative ABC transport system permease protein